jgi:predicted RNA-binding Zn-ribbon protein involved in translation (DUF1610 family)
MECPNCGVPMVTETDYTSPDEGPYEYCPRCGYTKRL